MAPMKCGVVLLVLTLCLTVSASPSASGEDHLTFITVGDWGGLGVTGTPSVNAAATARAMATLAALNNVSFIINVGDNFYENGVASTTDPLWESDWKNLFSAPSLQVPWYSVLGNHDYAGNPAAQVNYPNSPYWVMPDRNYVKRIYIPSADEYATFIFWDSNPCVSQWRGNDPSGWSPNTTTFHDNIIAQNCNNTQLWLTGALASATDRWIITVTHVPPQDVDTFDVVSLYNKYGVAVALLGHKHKLEYFTMKNSDVDFIISGAGCMVKNIDLAADLETTKNKTSLTNGGNASPLTNGDSSSSSNDNVDKVWSQKVTGISLHRFTHPGKHLETTFYDARTLTELYSLSSVPRADSSAKQN